MKIKEEHLPENSELIFQLKQDLAELKNGKGRVFWDKTRDQQIMEIEEEIKELKRM